MQCAERRIVRDAAERTFFLLAFLWLLGSSLLSFAYGQEKQPGSDSVRYKSDIEAFLKEDLVNPPPKGGILFIGSSIFRGWEQLKEQMAPLPVFNRAFGGSRTGEVLYYMDKVVLPYEPKIVVYYCGSNDINAGEKPADIFWRIRKFYERLAERLPDTRMYFVSINRAPQKRNRWDVVDSTNALVRKFCSVAKHLEYIDVNPVLFDAEGTPRNELFRDDQLHLKDRAYEEFSAIIKPILENAWKRK